MIDSLYYTDRADHLINSPIKRTVTEFDEPDRSINYHGAGVANVLTGEASCIEIVFYDVLQDVSVNDDKFPIAHDRDVCNAIYKAIDIHDIDVLNISLGSDHSRTEAGCQAYNQPCKLRQSARNATSEGIHICAAVGNGNKCDGPVCPATSESVISVGAADPMCTASVPEDNILSRRPETRPPLACWFDNPNQNPDDGVFCGGNDCSNLAEQSCSECRSWDVWPGNVDGHSNYSDIYAPHTQVQKNEDGYLEYAKGTSLATPLVTAVVSDRLAALRSVGNNISPSEMRDIVSSSGKIIESNKPLLNSEGIESDISDRKPVTFSRGASSDININRLNDFSP